MSNGFKKKLQERTFESCEGISFVQKEMNEWIDKLKEGKVVDIKVIPFTQIYSGVYERKCYFGVISYESEIPDNNNLRVRTFESCKGVSFVQKEIKEWIDKAKEGKVVNVKVSPFGQRYNRMYGEDCYFGVVSYETKIQEK